MYIYKGVAMTRYIMSFSLKNLYRVEKFIYFLYFFIIDSIHFGFGGAVKMRRFLHFNTGGSIINSGIILLLTTFIYFFLN